MVIKACIFDLDGTLLNTLDDLANSLNTALAKNNCPTWPIEEIQKKVGNGIRQLVRRSIPEDLSDELYEQIYIDFVNIYSVHKADKTEPYPGIVDLLETLRLTGYQLAVLSNKSEKEVQILCERFFPNIFRAIVGERRNLERKPSPDGIFEILEHLHVTKEEVLYIGDSEVDVETARRADVSCVACSWGFRSAEILKAIGAKDIIDTPQELLNKLFNK